MNVNFINLPMWCDQHKNLRLSNVNLLNRSTIRPGWMPDELNHAGRENLDADHVSRYDEKEDADAIEEVQILNQAGMNRRSVVVDLGAGTGQFTIAAAKECNRVIAVDISPVMLDRLRENAEAANLSNIDIVQSGFLTYEHLSPKADIVYSRFALHHLPDFWKVFALKRIRRMLKKNGLLRLWDVVYHFEPAETEQRLENWCQTAPVEADDNEWSRTDIEEHIRDEYSTFTWLLEPMIERNGFIIEEAHYSPDGLFARYIARAT
jgi:ubiquinone/menaquinone biosynthesis C-methylase UbiE